MAEVSRLRSQHLWSQQSTRDTDSRSPFCPGDKVDGRYLIDGYIARGGMSVVYRAIDTRLDRPVALKVLRSDLSARDEFRQDFVAEAKTVASLHGPGIVTVSDQGMWQGEAFLVMDLVAGGTVRELLNERGPMPPYAAVAVLRPTLEALAVAHSSGFVHCDIKPENILIGPDGTIKVVDFGLVRAVNCDDKEGHLAGTAAYLAPEQVTGDPITPQCDVYSAGLVLYELLVGTPPFGMSATRDVAEQCLSHDVPPASSQRPGIPTDFDAIISTATARNPEERYADAQEMCSALNRVRDKLHLPHYTVPTPQESAEQTAAQTALSTLAINNSEDHSDSEAATIPISGEKTEVIDAPPEEQPHPHATAHTALLTSCLPSSDDPATPSAGSPNSLGGNPAPDADDDIDDDEDLDAAEIRAWKLASHPRIWPVIIWLIVLVLIMGGAGIAMRSLGHELFPSAAAARNYTDEKPAPTSYLS